MKQHCFLSSYDVCKASAVSEIHLCGQTPRRSHPSHGVRGRRKSGLGCFPLARSLSICGFFVGKEVQTFWKIYPSRFISLNLNVWRGKWQRQQPEHQNSLWRVYSFKQRVFQAWRDCDQGKPNSAAQQHRVRPSNVTMCHCWQGQRKRGVPQGHCQVRRIRRRSWGMCESVCASPEHCRLVKQTRMLTLNNY